jgi:hypothetical protein
VIVNVNVDVNVDVNVNVNLIEQFMIIYYVQ